MNSVDGATDLYVEENDRSAADRCGRRSQCAIARYGLNISTVNETINTALAGQSAGLVYEGEKRFDLVVRLAAQNRNSIEDVRNLFYHNADRQPGAFESAGQSRSHRRTQSNTTRRCQEKDCCRLQSSVAVTSAGIVDEVRQKIDSQITFPTGYYPVYGGQSRKPRRLHREDWPLLFR